MHFRAPLLLTLALGGCSVSGVMPDWISDDAAGPEPANYRFTVANSLDSVMGKSEQQTRLLEISSPRRVDTMVGATWMVCIKELKYPSRLPRLYYTVLFRRETIAAARVSVGTDQCESQPYTPFEWSVDANKPVAR